MSLSLFETLFSVQFAIPESSSSFPQPVFTTDNMPTTPTRNCIAEDTGVYISEDDGLPRAFVNESPKVPSTPCVKTQVDLVLPDPIAFAQPGKLIYIDAPTALIITRRASPSLPSNSWAAFRYLGPGFSINLSSRDALGCLAPIEVIGPV